MHETRVLAEFVAGAKFDDVPDEVIARTKHLLLDHFAVALFATHTEWGRIALKYAREFSSIDECTVYGQPWKSSAQHAALANGLCAHGYELDDSYEGGFCHPGAPTIPAALAIAEKEGCSGRDFLLSVVMGYEVMGRISRALGRESNQQHHATGQVGAFGAATAAGKAMGLEAGRLTNALGLAGCMASGVMEFTEDPKGTMVKRLYGGWPSQSGIVAASFARDGYTAPGTIIEGRFGFLRGITRNYDLNLVLAGLGEDYQVMRTVFKPYASCRAFHPMVEGIIELRNEHGVTPDNLERLDVGVRESIMRQQIVYEPQSMMAAQYSMPFTAALALDRDLADPHCYDGEVLADRAIRDTCRKIHAHLDPEMDAFPRYAARLAARLKDGSEVKLTVWDHKGTAAKPFSAEDVMARFDKVTASVLRPGDAAELAQAVGALDSNTADAIQRLCAALRAPPPH